MDTKNEISLLKAKNRELMAQVAVIIEKVKRYKLTREGMHTNGPQHAIELLDSRKQLEEALANLPAEVEKLMRGIDALEELCRLKQMKDQHGKTPEYITQQPVVWNRAFRAYRDLIGDK